MQEKQQSLGLYTYTELQTMGFTVDNIVEKTVTLSADDISGYDSQHEESHYWLAHRRNNMSLFVCAMQGDTLLGHFSAMRVNTNEAMAFLDGNLAETDFTVITETDAQRVTHYVYISAVVVKKNLRNGPVAMRLIRQGHRLLNQYLRNTQQAQGIFAEAYSEEGKRLCELFGMNNTSANYYRLDRPCCPEAKNTKGALCR